MSDTAIMLGCKCGWVGMAHSSASALDTFHDHEFISTTDGHRIISEMGVSIPLGHPAQSVIRDEVASLNRVEAYRQYQRPQPRPVTADDTRRLIKGTINATGLTALIGALVYFLFHAH